MVRQVLLLIGLLVVGLIAGCGGSTTGTGGIPVSGRVLTSQGEPYAMLSITDTASGASTVTDEQGEYSFIIPFPPPGTTSILLLFTDSTQDFEAPASLSLPALEEGDSVIAAFVVDPEQQTVTVAELMSQTPTPTPVPTAAPTRTPARTPTPSRTPTPLPTRTATPDRPDDTPTRTPTPDATSETGGSGQGTPTRTPTSTPTVRGGGR